MKNHFRSPEHRQNLKQVFPQDKFRNNGIFPNIVFVDPDSQHCIKKPIVGLHLVTLCFTLESCNCFYLCHVCAEICGLAMILTHLSTEEHYTNYLNYTNPNALSFAWIPVNMKTKLSHEVMKEMDGKSSGNLQMLHLPNKLMEEFNKKWTYLKVMDTLSQNEKLLNLQKAVLPKWITIESYQQDSNRKHPLLGMQHLVECVRVGPDGKKRYLCTLCSLTVAPLMLIKHVLSFDHIYCYFKAWYPSTLMSKESYRSYTTNFVSMMVELSKQAEETHGSANAKMKKIFLEPEEFKLVNFNSYAEALKKMESIKKISLTISIKPEKQLERPAKEKLSTEYSPSYKLQCQNCSAKFHSIGQYLKHLKNSDHIEMVKKFFGEYVHVDQKRALYLQLHTYISECLQKKQPAVGVDLVVACVTPQSREPIYLCFGCRDCFKQSSVTQHLTSHSHLVNTLLYENPWRLPFAWNNEVDYLTLRALAWEEEEMSLNQTVLKIFDVPYSRFLKLIPPSFKHVTKELQHEIILLKREVPFCKTHNKGQDNERFPLLGINFMVLFNMSNEAKAGLCLLCERKLSKEEADAHVFSREHVVGFLDRFHPGSLNSNTDSPDALLDLATQAAKIHQSVHMQEIWLDPPIIEPCSYNKIKTILASVKRKKGKGQLEPTIKTRIKLVPRKTSAVKDSTSDVGRAASSSTSQLCVEKIIKDADKEVAEQSKREPEMTRQACSKTNLGEIKSAGVTCQKIGEPEEVSLSKTAGEITKSCDTINQGEGAVTGRKRSRTDENPPSQLFSQENVGDKTGAKRQRLTCKGEPLTMPIGGIKEDDLMDIEEINEAAVNKDIQSVKALHDQQSESVLSSTTALIQRDFTMDSFKEVRMEIDSDGSQEDAYWSSTIATTSKSTEAPLKSDEDDRTNKVLAPVGNPVPPSAVSKRSGDASSQHVSTCQTKKTHLPANSTGNDPKIYNNPNMSVDVLKKIPISNMEMRAVGSICTANKDPVASSKLLSANSLSVTSTSNITSETESAGESQSLQKQAGAAAKVKDTSFSVGSKPSSVSEAAVKSVETIERDKTSVTSRNEEVPIKTVDLKNAVGTKSKKRPPAPLSPADHIQSLTESSYTASTNVKPTENTLKVGLNKLIVVSSEGKQQVYCQLCSTKLQVSSSIHLASLKHKHKYVQMKYPEFNAKGSELEKKVNEIVISLAEAEKQVGIRKPQELKVRRDFYDELAALPEDRAVEKVKVFMRPKHSPYSSPGSAEVCSSPCEVSSSDDGKLTCMPHNEMARCSDNQPELEVKEQHCTVQLQTPEAMENPHNGAEPAAVDMLPQTSDVCQVTLDNGQQQNNNPEGADEASPPPAVAAPFNIEQEAKLKSSHSSPVFPGPGECSTSQRALTGEKSRLVTILIVRGLDAEPVIGLCSIIECQGIMQETFFLCECCEKNLPNRDIYRHMISTDHRIQCMMKNHSNLFNDFWPRENLQNWQKMAILNTLTYHLCIRERQQGLRPKVIMLRDYWHQRVQAASYHEAIYILQMSQEPNNEEMVKDMRAVSPQQKGQSPEDAQSLEESVLTRRRSSEVAESTQKNNNETRQMKKHSLKEMAMVGDLTSVTERRLSSPAAITCSSSQANAAICSLSTADSGLSPQNTCRSLSFQPKVAQQVSPSPPYSILLQQRREGSVPQSTISVHHGTSNTPLSSTRDDFLHSRKTPFDVSVETLIRSCTYNPLEQHLAGLSPQDTCSSLSLQSEVTQLDCRRQSPANSVPPQQSQVLSESQITTTVDSETGKTPLFTRDYFLPTRKKMSDKAVEALVRPCTYSPLEHPLPTAGTQNPQQPDWELSSEPSSKSTVVESAVKPTPTSHNDSEAELVSGKQNTMGTDWGWTAHLVSQLRSSKSENALMRTSPANPIYTLHSRSASSPKSVAARLDSNQPCTSSVSSYYNPYI
ncbi:uncharacterized protein KZ484_006313 isoform 3-T4 [Pholidichthys leucotaenia]